MASILVQWLRRKTQDRLPLWFGLLALLYGYRALLMTESARCFLSGRTIDFQIALVTFSIGIPGILFGWGLVSRTQNGGDQVAACGQCTDGIGLSAVLFQPQRDECLVRD